MQSTWEARDLPVLRVVVARCDQEGSVTAREIETDCSLEWTEVQQAIRALLGEDPPFFDASMRGGTYDRVGRVTGHARRTVGAWPNADELTDRLANAFAEAAELEPEPARKSLLRRGAELFGGIGRDVSSEVIAKVITQGM